MRDLGHWIWVMGNVDGLGEVFDGWLVCCGSCVGELDDGILEYFYSLV